VLALFYCVHIADQKQERFVTMLSFVDVNPSRLNLSWVLDFSQACIGVVARLFCGAFAKSMLS
jgi:hypothetical protein